jgi:hypothetical protein
LITHTNKSVNPSSDSSTHTSRSWFSSGSTVSCLILSGFMTGPGIPPCAQNDGRSPTPFLVSFPLASGLNFPLDWVAVQKTYRDWTDWHVGSNSLGRSAPAKPNATPRRRGLRFSTIHYDLDCYGCTTPPPPGWNYGYLCTQNSSHGVRSACSCRNGYGNASYSHLDRTCDGCLTVMGLIPGSHLLLPSLPTFSESWVRLE